MMDKRQILLALQEGDLRLEGQFIYGSNYTFLGNCEYEDQLFKVVYKPVKGERPLWDFPHQSLAKREVAAYVVSDAMGWDLVPPTVFRTKHSPMGPGSAQYYIEHDPEYHFFNFNKEDRKDLPQIMLFDLVINNADRKGGHLLVDETGHLWLIDHGLCFHVQDKLRTVIWEHAGKAISETLLSDLNNFHQDLSQGQILHQKLQPLLSPEEIRALSSRVKNLLKLGIFPLPPEDRRAYPWPLV